MTDARHISTTHLDPDTQPPENRDKQYRGAHDLGRDDPLWPRYVQDAEKWDNDMMNNWNSRMDVLLLFATLFSAIITAFLIEGSRTLRPDNSEITATVLIDIARTLRALTNETQIGNQNRGDPLPTLASYKPSSTNELVNMLWFLSLCLSIIVALVTSLVKQWCNSYVSDRIAPPCNQARIRQARFNKLNSWKAIWIVSMLPVLMHIALALFLIGLIFFLGDLNKHIWEAAFTVTALAAMGYLLMTLAPCFVPFCPYRTPLSSPELWGYFTQWLSSLAIYIYGLLFKTTLRPDFANHQSWCQRQQNEISNNTKPDEITGDALNWIILHTPESETRDMAIRSISGLKSEKALKQLVVDAPGILPQVIQSFTSCFPFQPLDREDNGALLETNTKTIVLHAQALLVLVNKIMRSLNDSESAPFAVSTWGVDNETVAAVEKRLQSLATTRTPSDARITGMTALSAWRRFVSHTYKSPDDDGELLVMLTKHLNWQLPPNTRSDILHAILVESANWTPKSQNVQRAQLLSGIVALICESNHDIPERFRAKLICSLAILMLSLNQGQTRLRLPPNLDQPDIEACITYNHARSIARYYVQNPGKILGDEPALLLLALAGLMEYYEHRIFDDSSEKNMAMVAPLLLTLDIFGRFQSVTLPAPVWLKVDLREYFLEVLANYFRHAPIDPLTNDAGGTEVFNSLADEPGNTKEAAREETAPRVQASIPLLQALVSNTTFWKDPAHVHALRAPILRVLSLTDNSGVRRICLKAITSNLDRTHSTSYVNMLFAFNVPYKLVKLMHEQEITQLKTPTSYQNTTKIFGLLSEDACGPPEGQHLSVDQDKSLKFMTQILSDGLLEAFVRHVLSIPAHEYNAYGKYWGRRILEAVETRLKSHTTRDENLQGTYNYLKKREYLMKETNDPRVLTRRSSLSRPDLITKLLSSMDIGNEELTKDYIRSKIPKFWLDKLEEFRIRNAEGTETSSPGAGSSRGPRTAQFSR